MARTPQRRRKGLPDPQSVVEVATLRPAPPAAPGAPAPAAIGTTYQILRTNEFDPKDRVRTVAPLGRAPARPSDDFAGTARKAAKLSISRARREDFVDLPELIATLPSKTAMKRHQPPIGADAGSGRVVEEKRNVRLNAFLYAASREDDNDFHLIIGRDAAAAGRAVYMTVEVSGLPPGGSGSFERLKAARNAFTGFFGSNLPGPSYDFYDPPIPVEVQGSLFFDISHANGQGPGPQTLRRNIPTIWEDPPDLDDCVRAMKQPGPKQGSGATDTGKGKPRTRRRGLPRELAIVAETTMASLRGATYRVLKTTEKDAYDIVDAPRKRDRGGD